MEAAPGGNSGYVLYRRTALARGVFAIAMDSRSLDPTEHNDVHLREPEPGLTRRDFIHENGKTRAIAKEPIDWWIDKSVPAWCDTILAGEHDGFFARL
jgi:hypothetical protein